MWEIAGPLIPPPPTRRQGGEGGSDRATRSIAASPGSKIHVLSDRSGLPLTALTSSANTHHAHLLVPLLDSPAPIRPDAGAPATARPSCTATQAYNNQYIRADLRPRRIGTRLARKGIEDPRPTSAVTAASSKEPCPGS